MIKNIMLCALAGGIFGSSVAYTQALPTESEQKPPGRVAKLDQKFRAADKDGDDALNKVEAQAAGLHRISDNFERIDSDKDGRVTRAEIRSMVRSRISS